MGDAVRLKRELGELEQKLDAIEDEIELLEARMVRAKGADLEEMELKLEKLDDTSEKLEKQIEEKKKQLEFVEKGGKLTTQSSKSGGLTSKKVAPISSKDDEPKLPSVPKAAPKKLAPRKDLSDDDSDDDLDDDSEEDDDSKGASSLLQKYFTPSPRETPTKPVDTAAREIQAAREGREASPLSSSTSSGGDREVGKLDRLNLEKTSEDSSRSADPGSARSKTREQLEREQKEKEKADKKAKEEADKKAKEEARRKAKEEAKLKAKNKAEEKKKKTLTSSISVLKNEKPTTPGTPPPPASEKKEAPVTSKSVPSAATSTGDAPRKKLNLDNFQLKTKDAPVPTAKDAKARQAGAGFVVKNSRDGSTTPTEISKGRPASVIEKKEEPPVTSAMLEKMSDEEVTRRFATIMEGLGIAQSIWSREYNIDQQKAIILSFGQKNSALALTLNDELDSGRFLALLKSNCDSDNLEKLRAKLETAPIGWITEFGTSGGTTFLLETLGFILYKASKTKQALDEKEAKKIDLIASCISEMVNNGTISASDLVSSQDSVKNIVFSWEHVSIEAKTDICDLLAAICLLSDAAWGLVTEAMSTYQVSKPKQFKALLDELKTGDDLEFKISFLTLLNTMIVKDSDIVDRVRLRQRFMSEGLGEILAELKAEVPDEELQEQILAFDEELENDLKDVGFSKDQFAVYEDPSDIVTSLWETIVGSGLEKFFISSLRHLQNIGAIKGPSGQQIWSLIDELLEKCSKLFAKEKLTSENLTLEEVLMSFLSSGNRATVKGQAVPPKTAPGTASVKAAPALETKSASSAKIATPAAPAAAPAIPAPAAVIPAAEEKPVENVEEASSAPAPPAPPAPGPPPPPPPPGGPPAPPPPPGGGPPPPPPPPGGKGGPPGPPPPPGMKGKAVAVTVSPFFDEKRPKLQLWRWNALPQRGVEKTIFSKCDPMKINFDKDLLIEVLKVKEVPKKGEGEGEDGEGEDGHEPAPAKPTKEEEAKPKVLDQQRCTVIEIIMKRMTYPVAIIKEAIKKADLSTLSVDTLGELTSLFPAKSYEAEKQMLMENFKGDPSELARPERFVYELLTIPDVRAKLLAMIFCLEYPVKLLEAKENLDKVLTALKELKADNIVKILEISLALGNFINNAKQQAFGFKLSSLLKMAEVKTRESKTTLLHYIAKLVETKYPELVNWPEDLPGLKAAPGAIASSQMDVAFLQGGIKQLQKEIGACGDNPDLAPLKAFFTESKLAVEGEIQALENLQKDITNDVCYFGEPNNTDIPSFFSQWEKFAQMFSAAVKYNKAQQKKEAAMKAKEDAKKKKEEEEKMVSKVITTIRKSQANLKAMARDNTDMLIKDNFLSGKTRQPRETRPTRERERPKKEVTSLVDDILSNNPAFSNRPRRNMRDQDGQVQQLSKALRNSRTFTKLRENRDAAAADKGVSKEVSQATKQALQRQLSTKLPRSRA